MFLLLIVLADAKPVLLPRVSLSVTFMIAVVAIIRMPPAAVTLLTAVSVLGTVLAGEKRPPHKLVFNSAQLALAGGLAAECYRLLGGSSVIDAGHLPSLIVATAGATFVYFLVNTLAVAGAISISTRSGFIPTWLENFGWLTATYAAFGGSGLILASLYQLVGVLALPLLLVPLLVARGVFRSHQEVIRAYESTILSFVAAIEAKDAYTRGHSERVTEYAMMIARRGGHAQPELEAFRYGALLHDIGKLAVRRAILTKPSSLEPEEYAEIKRHPALGAQIVSEIDFLRPALDGVLYHHERLDGSGYPAGLVGDMVPEQARIMAVADSFDAMTSTRAYRGSRSADEAVAELRRCSGRLYDPRFVEMFVDALAESSGEHEAVEAVMGRETTSPVPTPAG